LENIVSEEELSKGLSSRETSGSTDTAFTGSFAHLANVQIGVFETWKAHGTVLAASTSSTISQKTVRTSSAMLAIFTMFTVTVWSVWIVDTCCAGRAVVAFLSAFMARFIQSFDHVPVFWETSVRRGTFCAIGTLFASFQFRVFGTRKTIGTFVTFGVLVASSREACDATGAWLAYVAFFTTFFSRVIHAWQTSSAFFASFALIAWFHRPGIDIFP